jgi:hypothetical protein
LNDPDATPLNVWMSWVWQFDGQWWTISVHDRLAAPSVPCSGSVAGPEKLIVVPTAQVKLDDGESMTDRERRHVVDVDRRRRAQSPVAVGDPQADGVRGRTSCTCEAVFRVASPYVPSPLRSQLYVRVSPASRSGSGGVGGARRGRV